MTANDLKLGDRAFATLQYALPKHFLSHLVYRITRSEQPWLRRALISTFLRNYTIDMSEAERSDPLSYNSFNDFFTRSLKPNARIIDAASDAFVSPVDGGVSQCGELRCDTLIQAKGRDYTLTELLARDTESVAAYQNGSFACLYLAPFNYHRIHMPYAGRLRSSTYVPGDLFSVNAATARAVPNLFARNERVICDFDCSFGRMAMILVGALFVGSIETVLHGEINPPRMRRGRPTQLINPVPAQLMKGAELGRFNMGSTVVLLAQSRTLAFSPEMKPDSSVRMGKRIATVVGA